ncbi:DNA alkylation repair protein, partial [Rothia sp. LK2492]
MLEEILITNFGSTEFFINKAIGGALRQYFITDPVWV